MLGMEGAIYSPYAKNPSVYASIDRNMISSTEFETCQWAALRSYFATRGHDHHQIRRTLRKRPTLIVADPFEPDEALFILSAERVALLFGVKLVILALFLQAVQLFQALVNRKATVGQHSPDPMILIRDPN